MRTIANSILCFNLLMLTLQFAMAQVDQTSSLKLDKLLMISDNYEKQGDYKEASRFMNEAANLAWENKNYDNAIVYFKKSISQNERISNLSGISKIHSNLGMIYSDIQQYDKSLDYFNKSLDYRLKEGRKEEVISTRINISVVLNILKKHDEAAKQLENALIIATEMNDANQMKSCYGMLAETYEKAGNQEKTVHYFNLYRTFHEMIQRNKINEANKQTEQANMKALQTEIQKREREIELLKATRELQVKDEQLEQISAEAQTLIENNTKHELALNLLERKLEIDTLRAKEVAHRKEREQLIMIIVVLIIAASLSIVIVNIYKSSRIRKAYAKLNEANQRMMQLELQLKDLPEYQKIKL